MTEQDAMDKPRKKYAQPLSAILAGTLGDVFSRQGFAAAELVTRWADVVGEEIAVHAEPVKIMWPREGADPAELATLVLRVEGPAALEIQHMSKVLLERVNRFLGWRAVGKIAMRQAPLRHRTDKRKRIPLAPAEVAGVAATLGAVADDDLRAALSRLGASVKRR
jgi:hypothetical protein